MPVRLFGHRSAESTAPQSEPVPSIVSPQQHAFFDTFGFVKFEGLFRDDLALITDGFEEIFAKENPGVWETNEELHLAQKRIIVPQIVTKTEKLSWLLDDPRVVGIVSDLIGPGYEYADSDGNLFYCESSWHPDTFGAPLTRLHVKLSFYLDPLHGDNGAIRMIPGTNHHRTPFARALRANLEDPRRIAGTYGVEPDEIPSWTIESEPGDVVVWNFRSIHASFNGGERRRLFSINFREPESAEAQ